MFQNSSSTSHQLGVGVLPFDSNHSCWNCESIFRNSSTVKSDPSVKARPSVAEKMQSGQHHSPAGMDSSGGARQKVWNPLSHLSHRMIWSSCAPPPQSSQYTSSKLTGSSETRASLGSMWSMKSIPISTSSSGLGTRRSPDFGFSSSSSLGSRFTGVGAPSLAPFSVKPMRPSSAASSVSSPPWEPALGRLVGDSINSTFTAVPESLVAPSSASQASVRASRCEVSSFRYSQHFSTYFSKSRRLLS
mmetsp:Transcript_343/g.1107  ORF Transcript_343/g.1107 Transcript_343/m.1107 type:complete len:246 (+) Transcript_343:2844-3581(+)